MRRPAEPAGIVAARDREHVAAVGDELGAVVHADAQATAHLILEVLDLAAVASNSVA